MAQKPKKKLWEIVGGALGLVEDKTGLQAAPMPQQAPMQTTAPSTVGQALAQRPGEIPLKRPGLPAPTEIGMPTTPERLGDPAATYDPYSIGGTRLGHAALRAFGPESAMGKIGTALATDPTVQAHVGQIAMALGAKSPRGVGYQLGQSIVKSAEGQQYQMLQEYFGDIISGREPREEMDLENLTLSPELRAKAFNDVLVQTLGGARVKYFEAGARRQEAEAAHIETRTPEVIAAEEVAEDAETERIRLARQTESRQFAFEKSGPGQLYDLMREKMAFDTGEEFWQHMGIDRPPDIPVKWDEAKEQRMQELFARTGLDPNLGALDDTAIEAYIQSLLDQGMTEEQAFDYLIEMGIK